MWKFIKQNWILILSVIYILSPIDLIPEFLLGPLGIIDDAAVLIGLLVKAVYDYWRSHQRRRADVEVS